MPVTIRKNKKTGKVSVRTPGGIKAAATSMAKALKQAKLLRAIENGWKPTKKK